MASALLVASVFACSANGADRARAQIGHRRRRHGNQRDAGRRSGADRGAGDPDRHRRRGHRHAADERAPHQGLAGARFRRGHRLRTASARRAPSRSIRWRAPSPASPWPSTRSSPRSSCRSRWGRSRAEGRYATLCARLGAGIRRSKMARCDRNRVGTRKAGISNQEDWSSSRCSAHRKTAAPAIPRPR